MTEEELDKIERRACDEGDYSVVDVTLDELKAIFALARVGLAVTNAQEIIERMAIAMYEHQFHPTGCPPSWRLLTNDYTKQIFREKAQAAFSALPKPGGE